MCNPHLLLCGGIDPSCEAGITADVRHAERLGAHYHTITTAITSQNANKFLSISAVQPEQISEQLTAIQFQSAPDIVKIGLVASLHQLHEICTSIA